MQQFSGSLNPQFQLKSQQQKKNCQSSQKSLLQQLERFQSQTTQSSSNIQSFQQFNCFPKTSSYSCRNSVYGLWSPVGERKDIGNIEAIQVQRQDKEKGREKQTNDDDGSVSEDIPNYFIRNQLEKQGKNCSTNMVSASQSEDQSSVPSPLNNQHKEMITQNDARLLQKRKEPMNSKYKLKSSKSTNNTKSNISTVVHSQQHPQVTSAATHRTHILMNKMIQNNIHQPKSIIRLTSNSMFFHPNSSSHSTSPKAAYQNEVHSGRKEQNKISHTQQDQTKHPQGQQYQFQQYFSTQISETNKAKLQQARTESNSESSGIFNEQTNDIDAVIERTDGHQFNTRSPAYPNQHKTSIMMNPYKCIRYCKKLSSEDEKVLRESSPVWLFACKNESIKQESICDSATQTTEKSAQLKVEDDKKMILHRPQTHQVNIQPQQIDRFKLRNSNSPHFFHQIQAINYTPPISYISNRLNSSKSEYHPNQAPVDMQQPAIFNISETKSSSSKSQLKCNPRQLISPSKPPSPSSPYYYYSAKHILAAQLCSEEPNKSQTAITPPLLTCSPSCTSTAEVTLEASQQSPNFQTLLEKQQSSPVHRNTLTAPSLSRKRAFSSLNKHKTDCLRLRNNPKVSIQNQQCLKTFDDNINGFSRSCGQSLTPSQQLIEISTQMENNFFSKNNNNILAKKTSLQIVASSRSKQQAAATAAETAYELHPSLQDSQKELHDESVQPWSRNDSDLDIDLF